MQDLKTLFYERCALLSVILLLQQDPFLRQIGNDRVSHGGDLITGQRTAVVTEGQAHRD